MIFKSIQNSKHFIELVSSVDELFNHLFVNNHQSLFIMSGIKSPLTPLTFFNRFINIVYSYKLNKIKF